MPLSFIPHNNVSRSKSEAYKESINIERVFVFPREPRY
jgi:hypothetical protein